MLAVVEVAYESSRLEDTLSNERAVRKQYGAQCLKALARRFTSLRNADTLAELHHHPGRTHPLSGDRAREYAMDLPAGRRPILRPTPPVPTLGDGGIDTARVTRVTVVEISEHYA